MSEKPYLTEITIESVDDTTTGCELVSGNAILGDDIMVVREDRSAADICDDAELESEFDASTEPPTLLERRRAAGAKVDSALEMVAKEAIVGEFG